MAHSVTQTISLSYDALLAVLYPQRCEVCGGSVERRALGVACEQCWKSTRLFNSESLICWKCGRPSLREVSVAKREDVSCHRCEDETFASARACGVYEGALRASVLALKREPHIPERLKSLLVQTQTKYPLCSATRIIPVPLHPERLKARGFNQAEVIATALSRACGVQLDTASLVRTQYVERHRAGMDVKDRRKSVDNAFEVVHPNLVRSEKVLLVDDVFTTGATASACATALLQAGVEEVFVVTIARPVY